MCEPKSSERSSEALRGSFSFPFFQCSVTSVVRAALEESIESILTTRSSVDILRLVQDARKQGKTFSIVFCGVNGVGKSTLFRCVLGLLRDYTGSITVEGRDARSLSIRESAKLIAYIPQSSHPAFNYSVRDIVLMGTTSGLGTFSTPKKEDVRRVDEALEKIGILELAERLAAHALAEARDEFDAESAKMLAGLWAARGTCMSFCPPS